LFDVFERHQSEIEDLRDSGDRVPGVLHGRGVRRPSGAGVHPRLHGVWIMREARIVCGRFDLDAAGALKADRMA
jgi:hypothetical protein